MPRVGIVAVASGAGSRDRRYFTATTSIVWTAHTTIACPASKIYDEIKINVDKCKNKTEIDKVFGKRCDFFQKRNNI